MKPKTRMSLGFSESFVPGQLSVNLIYESGANANSSMEVSFSVREIFEKHGASHEYVIVIPMTRLQYQSEHFRTDIEAEAMNAGVSLVFENPHLALEREARNCLDPDPHSHTIIVQVDVTREGEIIIAGTGNSSMDAEIPDNSFLFKSHPVSFDNDNDDNESAIEAVLSEAVLFIERSLIDDFTQILLTAETTGISQSVRDQFHQMLKHLNVEIHDFNIEDRLKGALIEKHNKAREADQHLRQFEAETYAGNYPAAYGAIQAAIDAHPCQIVLEREKEFQKNLSEAADSENGTGIKRFAASIEKNHTRLVQLWQTIARVESEAGLRSAEGAQFIANLIQCK